MKNFSLTRENTALLVVDVQEKVLAQMEKQSELLSSIQKMIKGALILDLPIIITEQYPKGLGSTTPSVKDLLKSHVALTKTTFSCMQDESVKKTLLETPQKQWILVGLETHVCILQTAKELLREGREVTVLNNAVASRSIHDYSTAISEMRDLGVRISTVETSLFELVKNSKDPKFKEISLLVR
jgi:nicotinamidase-related amidase